MSFNPTLETPLTAYRRQLEEPYKALKEAADAKIPDLEWEKNIALVSHVALKILAVVIIVGVLVLTSAVVLTTAAALPFIPVFVLAALGVSAEVVAIATTVAAVASMILMGNINAFLLDDILEFVIQLLRINELLQFVDSFGEEYDRLSEEIDDERQKVTDEYDRVKALWDSKKDEREILLDLFTKVENPIENDLEWGTRPEPLRPEITFGALPLDLQSHIASYLLPQKE
jgi:hypothetical protein